MAPPPPAAAAAELPGAGSKFQESEVNTDVLNVIIFLLTKKFSGDNVNNIR